MKTIHPIAAAGGGRATTVCMALLCILLAAGAAAAVPGADVLDTPARPSAPALKRTLSGVAVQGTTVLAVGARGTVLVSRDGGKNWTQASVPLGADLTTVRFSAPGVAWALGHDAVLLRTNDSGSTWVRVLDGRMVVALMHKHYTSLAAAGNAGATELLSELERATGQSATPGVLPYPFLDIRIGADGVGFLAGAFGLLLHTADGGKTWEPWLEKAANDRRMHLYALEQGADGAIYLAGEQGLLRRYDRAGARFTELASPYTGTFFGLKASGASLAAFGLRGNAFVSGDNGASWKAVPLGGSASVIAAISTTAGQFSFVSQAGQVLRTGGDAAGTPAATGARGEVFDAALNASGQLVVAGSAGVTLLPMPPK